MARFTREEIMQMLADDRLSIAAVADRLRAIEAENPNLPNLPEVLAAARRLDTAIEVLENTIQTGGTIDGAELEEFVDLDAIKHV